MKVRELFQIELWSKITSRKICIGIGIVIVGLFSWCEVEKYWLTPGERDAGWTALAQIEELENSKSIQVTNLLIWIGYRSMTLHKGVLDLQYQLQS